MDEMKKHVEALIDKASSATNPSNALHFSQAAYNAANAYSILESIKRAK